MKFKFLTIFFMVSLLATQAQNRRQLIAFLVHKNDSLHAITQKQQQQLETQHLQLTQLQKSQETLKTNLDSLNVLRLSANDQLIEKEKMLAALQEVKNRNNERTDSILESNLRLQQQVVATQAKMNTLALQLQLLSNHNPSENLADKLSLQEIRGMFTRVFHDGCFHLMFRNEQGAELNFGNATNAFPFEVYTFNADTQTFELSERVRNKTVTLVVGLLWGVLCPRRSEQNYVQTPTIIHIQPH